MFFKRSEKSRWRPGVVIAIGALAALGAVSITEKSKKWVKDKWHRVYCLVKKKEED